MQENKLSYKNNAMAIDAKNFSSKKVENGNNASFSLSVADKDLESLQSMKSGYCMVEHSNELKSVDQGIEYYNKGEYSDAEEFFKNIISTSKASGSVENLEYVLASRYLAKIYTHFFQHKDAIEIYNQIIPIQKQLLGPEHNDVIVYMSELARLYSFVEDYQNAGPLYVSCYTTCVYAYGEQHPTTAVCLNNLGKFLSDQVYVCNFILNFQ